MDSFVKLAEHPEYAQINARLVATLRGHSNVRTVVDLGCGTGAVSELVLRECPRCEIIAVEPDAELLEAAARRLAGHRVQFLLAPAEAFAARLSRLVDAVLMGNCFHLMEDKQRVLRQVAAVLRPGGVFAFNTMFHREGQVEGTRRFYVELMVEAHKYLRSHAPGLHPSTGERPVAKRVLSADQYRTLLECAGFSVYTVDHRVVDASEEMVKLLIQSPMFSRGALAGIPPELSAQALLDAADRVKERHALRSLPRRFLTMAGTLGGQGDTKFDVFPRGSRGKSPRCVQVGSHP